jgi:hypothetical protein
LRFNIERANLMGMREEKDLDILIRLKGLGSDLSKLHEVDFFLYFPTEEMAKSASSEIEKEGYSVRVNVVNPPYWKRLFSKAIWSCCASKSIVPEKEKILQTSEWFNRIAQRYCGEYDGWGSEVTE